MVQPFSSSWSAASGAGAATARPHVLLLDLRVGRLPALQQGVPPEDDDAMAGVTFAFIAIGG